MKKLFRIAFLFFTGAIFFPAVALAASDARFVSQTVPQTMTAGQTYQVSIVMKNTGTTAWAEADKFRLGSQNPQDNGTWREGRVYLAAGESIAPGQAKTFTFDVKAPATPGAYNFQWRMVQEGVEWFGQKTQNLQITVSSPDSNPRVESFAANSDPIAGLWTYYSATIVSPAVKNVVLSLDIYPSSGASHPDRHHGFFNKQVNFSAGESKTIKIRYDWQGKAQYDLGSGWVDADAWYNGNCCGLVDYAVRLVVWEGSQAIAQKTISQKMVLLGKKVSTFYFYWYEGDTGGHIKCPNYDLSQKDYLTDDPIYGKGSWFTWKNPDMHKVELARMKRSGIDIALPVYWGDCVNTCNFGGNGNCPANKKWSDGGLDKMVEGIQRLEAAAIGYPLIGMFYDTSANALQYGGCEQGLWQTWPSTPVDLSVAHNQDVFYQMIKDFYSRIPEKYVAKIGGRYPVWLYAAEYFKNIDCRVFDLVRDRFRRDFGKELMIIAPNGFCNNDKDSSGTYNILSGFNNDSTDKLDISGVLPGYDHEATTIAYGCGGDRNPLIVNRNGGQFYLGNWDKALVKNEGWINVMGGWNELHEGSDIMATEQYGTKYLELTNQKSSQFKGSAPNWVECVMNEECRKNDKDFACIANKCAATGNNAQFVSQNVPQTMTVGQTYAVSVTMKNTGTTVWSESSQFRLGSQNPQDNNNWNIGRITLNAGESIAPGRSKTFTFDVKAPAVAGTYNFQWRMVQDGVEWFGDKTPNVAVAVVSSASCIPKTCATLGNYQCGSWSDGCGKTLNCGTCTSGKTCNAAGQCVSQTTGGPVISDSDPQTLTETPQKMTRAEILQKIAQIKQLLVQLIVQLIAELQKQLAGMGKN